MARGMDWWCRVYFEDTDAGGVVYYANYLKFYERGRTEFLRALGYEQDQLLQHNIVFVVRNICVDFKQAARFNEQLRVKTRVASIKRASLVFEQSIFCMRNDEDVLINQAEVVIVCVDSDRFVPTAIPREIVRALNHHE